MVCSDSLFLFDLVGCTFYKITYFSIHNKSFKFIGKGFFMEGSLDSSDMSYVVMSCFT